MLYRTIKRSEHTERYYFNSLKQIPEYCDSEIMYSLDNAWALSKGVERTLQRSFFVDKNLLLPPSRLSVENHSSVVHVRQTDGGYRYRIEKFLPKLPELLEVLWKKWPNGEVIIHTDGNTEKFKSLGVEVYGKDSNVLEVFSDFIHCDTLVVTQSSLSIAASHLGPKEVIAVNSRKINAFMSRLPSWAVSVDEYLALERDLIRLVS